MMTERKVAEVIRVDQERCTRCGHIRPRTQVKSFTSIDPLRLCPACQWGLCNELKARLPAASGVH